MKLIIATNNAHKAQEIRQILADSFSALDTLREAGLAIEVVEDGATFAENAVKKAEQVLAAAPGYDAALSDDSGLAVDALGGAPGVYSARYAGPQHDDADNNRKLMADMAGVPDGQRGCRFVCAVALARRGRPTVTAEGACEGVLLRAPRGENGFGYDPYFYYPPAGRTFAELTGEAKNAVSHRRRALESLRALLAQERRQRGA
ncbi:MAG TPA: XTP/dITP diphosphatase [Candidatus Aphodomorpha intestinavium]|uniref:dITP/XTP pyrophosphatase n=1 Tax=Candidatus Aphodomorpha intestinavium TaxID=2840672 RepID=A0A9D1STM4_9FIRM|nr:XTP/dITP diphosphatase [Candidatus Aphodomorpha intestinavium]